MYSGPYVNVLKLNVYCVFFFIENKTTRFKVVNRFIARAIALWCDMATFSELLKYGAHWKSI